MAITGHDDGIRDSNLIKSTVDHVKLIYEQKYVEDIFELAATYIKSIAMNHAFVDGNKRVALAAALIFLDCNGYEINPVDELDLANLVIDFINKKVSEKDISEYFRNHSRAL